MGSLDGRTTRHPSYTISQRIRNEETFGRGKMIGPLRQVKFRGVKKVNQWDFGMKTHIGADVVTGLIHTVKGTAANVSQVAELLYGEEKRLHGDGGYIGAEKRLEGHRPEMHIARKRGTVRAMPEGPERDQAAPMNGRRPSCVRSWSIRSMS